MKCGSTNHSTPLSSDFSSLFSNQRARSDTTDATQTSFSYDIGSELLECCQPELPPSSTNQDVQRPFPGAPVISSNKRVSDIFEPFPTHMDATDLEYLKSRQALALPGQTLQNHLLQTYTRFVHRNVPILDMDHFLAAINSKESTQPIVANKKRGRIPLLLFQAVMFAAVGYADIDTLMSAGYKGRRAAQDKFYRRARVSPPYSLIHIFCMLKREDIIRP